MAVFEYRGLLIASGKPTSGVRDADNAKVLRQQLKREGILLTEASEDTKKKASRGGGIASFFKRVNAGDISMMTRQLATLVNAGIPLVQSVGALIEQVDEDKEELKRVLSQVRDRLNEGSSLAKALEAHPTLFPPIYVNMVAAGEASGTLETVLERLSDFMEGQARMRGKVVAALAYPVLMMGIGSLLMGVMMVFVVPKVTSIFASLDRALPWYTALLIFVSNVLASNQMLGFVMAVFTMTFVRRALAPSPTKNVWVGLSIGALVAVVSAAFMVESFAMFGLGVVLGVVGGLVVSRFLAFLSTPEGQLWKDTKILTLPVMGKLARMLAVSRFARTLATLLQSGVPLLRALDIVKHVLDNARLAKVVEEAGSSIREGESIAGPLKRSGEFPPIVTHMIAVGEKSGQLEQMLENVAKSYDAQVDTTVQALTSLLEPLIIVFMGGGVGFIAFSIMMPLIQMNDFVQ